MHTAEALEEAVTAARRLGFNVRLDWLGGSGGGDCEIRGEKWLFVDLALSTSEQLDQVLEALRREADSHVLPLPVKPELATLLSQRRSA
jgi:hypothetical protein